jgi:hypothetical protein
MSRVVASVLLTEREHRALARRARAGGLGPALIALAEKDIRAHGSEPMVLPASTPEPVAKKLSVAIPARLADAIDDRRGTASHGAYLRALLGKRDGHGAERRGEVVARAARPLPAGWFKALLGDQGSEAAIVLRVADAATIAEDWEQHVWSGITPGETGWLLVGIDENGQPASLNDRGPSGSSR